MRILSALILCVTLAACSSTPVPEQHLYMLNAGPVNVSGNDGFRIGIDSVTVPPYLRRSEMMLEVSEQEIRPARYHRWAEPLAEGVSQYLRDDLSKALNTAIDTNPQFRSEWAQSIAIEVHRLHGDLDGSVQIDATYTIRAGDQLTRKRFAATVAQSGVGYPALVDAHATLLSRLAADIRQNL